MRTCFEHLTGDSALLMRSMDNHTELITPRTIVDRFMILEMILAMLVGEMLSAGERGGTGEREREREREREKERERERKVCVCVYVCVCVCVCVCVFV